jgi:hypothetical protein
MENQELIYEEEGLPNLMQSKRKDLLIIGLFARAKKVKFTSQEQQAAFVRRNIRAARELISYDYNQIIKTMLYLIKFANFKWTLETVGKYIDEDLNSLAQKTVKLDEI